MSQKIICRDAQQQLQHLKTLESAFAKSLDETLDTKKNANEISSELLRTKELKMQVEQTLVHLKESINPFEVWFDLKNQYEWQIAILSEAKILYEVEVDGKKEIGMFDIDGNFCRIPTEKEIIDRMRNKQELLKEKREQGFGRFLLVPFGIPLKELVEAFGNVLKAYYVTMPDPKDPNKKIPDPEKTKVWGNFYNSAINNFERQPVVLDEQEPVVFFMNIDGDEPEQGLVYYPKNLDRINHFGQTKREILQQQDTDHLNGWDILLLPLDKDIPPKGEERNINERVEIAAGKEASNYFNLLNLHNETRVVDKQYRGEEWMTPEAWIAYALSELIQNHEILEENGVTALNLGAFLPMEGDPDFFWGRVPAVSLNRESNQVIFSDADAMQDWISKAETIGARPAVRI